jgi:3-hexulose-6-phosphate synthase
MTVKVQLALDTLDEKHALKLAQEASPWVDILEAGTPLIKCVGIGVVSKLKETCPGKIVLADLKSTDIGAREAEMAFNAGADIVTTQGITTLATISAVQKEAEKWQRRAQVDMTGVVDPVARAKEVMDLGISLVLYQRSIDEEISQRVSWDEKTFQVVSSLCDLGLDVVVSGGVNLEIIPLFSNMPLFGIVVGRGITSQPDPAAAAAEIRELVNEIWID